MISAAQWAGRLDARDRGLLERWMIRDEHHLARRWVWIGVTQGGSAVVAIGAVLLPLLWGHWPGPASWRAGVALAVSHVAVQLVKRGVHRPRPPAPSLVRCPDRFSFPSGHAAASLAVGMSYAIRFPAFAAPLLAFAVLVGWSRVMLGVHYPGDVLAGQMIAIVTVLAIQLLH